MSNPWHPSVRQGSNVHSECSMKKRAKAVLSDDEIKANIVESRFRTGWPKLVPQPTISRLVSNPSYYIAKYEQKISTFENILQAQGVSCTLFRLVERKSVGPSRSMYPTLLVEASSRSGSWYNAVLELAKVIQTTGGDGCYGAIHVEIVEKGSDEPRIFPIRADDTSILHIWGDLRKTVAQVLSESRVRWKLLSLVKLACRVHGEDAGRPATTTTVLIEAWDADIDTWKVDFAPRLKVLIEGAGIDNVEIWQAQEYAVGNSDNLDVTGLPERTWLEKPLRIGDGLAPQGSPSTGTLGGFVRIEDPARKVGTTCILTSCSVVKSCPGLENQTTSNPPERALQALNITDTSSNYTLQSPTDPDQKRKTKLLEQEIQATKEEMYGHGLPPGSPPCLTIRAKQGDERAVEALQASQKEIDRLEAQVRHLSDAPNFIAGAVRAASLGYQCLPEPDDKRVALDWALVQVAPGRAVNAAFSWDNHRQPNLDLPNWARREFQSWRKLSQSKTDDVLKVGRATGWTEGEINYAGAWLNLREEGHAGQEYGTIVNCTRVENPRRLWFPFSLRGDSGSMVLDAKDGACVGLLFGGDQCGRYGLMTPIEDVFSSIEEFTGCRVVLPRLVP